MKIIKRHYEVIIIVLLLAILLFFNVVSFFERTFFSSFYPVKEVNAFSFWWYILNYNIGQILVYISPLVITFVGLLSFHRKLSSGFYKNVLLRVEYKKFINFEFKRCYLKGASIFPIISILVLLIGLFLLTDKIMITNTSNPILYVPAEMIGHELNYIIFSIILLFLYGILMINIGLVCSRYISKFYLVLLITFVAVNGINFCVGNVLVIFANIINNEMFYNIAVNVNIYNGYFPNGLIISYITIIICLLISFITLYIVYKDKKGLMDIYG